MVFSEKCRNLIVGATAQLKQPGDKDLVESRIIPSGNASSHSPETPILFNADQGPSFS